jgi:Zn-dependent peptidase ImmA (M78 family)
MNATLNPLVLRWARERAGLDVAELARKIFGKSGRPDAIREWEQTGQLSFHAAELLARKTYTPFGYLFLGVPPREELPIKDFRTIGSASIKSPSPDLLEVIYECQRRQAWYREHLVDSGAEPLDFVGRFSADDSAEATAQNIRDRLQIGAGLSTGIESWRQNLILHFEAAENAGILVMRNGVVGNNPHRKLSLDEFRGFSLADEYSPLVFINTRDAKAAQLFTFVHEIAHIWIGESAVSNPDRTYTSGGAIEQYCNRVAAEVLIPIAEFRQKWRSSEDPETESRSIAKEYKVSSLVALRRALDAGFISRDEFRQYYQDEIQKFREYRETGEAKEGGGNFYNSLKSRSSDRFCRALIASTLEGKTSYREAFGLLGLRNTKSFANFARARFGYLMNEVPGR